MLEIKVINYIDIKYLVLEKDDPNACLKRFLKYPPVENLA